ncbi:MAG: hypothetical protein APF76_17355 [Desulfitibacter sp. BRH_c19]|nr:MAG: hypothetical protein APF76_17355 [Desulfitibacter sp. BRH_c19]
MAQIALERVSFRYEKADEYAIKDISLTINPGEFVVLTGPAGAGKSTMAYCINGVIPHFQRGMMQGDIFLEGQNSKQLTTGSIAKMVGSVFQDPEAQIVCARVDEEIAFGLENLGVPSREITKRIGNVLELVGIEELKYRPTNALSGGQKQRVAIAAVLAMEPTILVLDEPTSELDPFGTSQVIELLHRLNKEKKITIVLVEQKIEEAISFATRLVIMQQGEIVIEGEPAKVLTKDALLKSAGVKLPQLVNLAYRLGLKEDVPLDLLDAEAMVRNYVGR